MHLAVAGMVALGVKASGVEVAAVGVSVGKVKPGFVGGRVEVTKRGAVFVGAFSCETVRQPVSMRVKISVQIVFLFMGLKYNANKCVGVPAKQRISQVTRLGIFLNEEKTP